jgi:hypothetical protein
MKKALLSVLLASLFLLSEAQNEKFSKVVVSDVYVSTGFIVKDYEFELEDIRLLSPDSEFINKDFSGYEKGKGGYSDENGIFSIQLGLSIRDREGKAIKHNPTLKVGFSWLVGNQNGPAYNFTSKTRIDTLRSSNGMHQILLDSIYSSSIYMAYKYQNLLADASLVYSTDSQRRFSFFGGIGMAAGISIKAKTISNKIDYSRYFYSKTDDYLGSYYDNFLFNEPSDDYKTKNKNNFLAQISFPMGFQFRLSKKLEVLKDIHLTYSFTPGVSFINIPETGNYLSGYSIWSLGLKFNVKPN